MLSQEDDNTCQRGGGQGRKEGIKFTYILPAAHAQTLDRSFESLLKYAPRQHMVLALQAIERAVAGAWGGSNQGLGFESDNVRGCQVVPVVAAGVDCLGLALQAVSGKPKEFYMFHCTFDYITLCSIFYIQVDRIMDDVVTDCTLLLVCIKIGCWTHSSWSSQQHFPDFLV